MDGATKLDAARVRPRVLGLRPGGEQGLSSVRAAEILGHLKSREVKLAGAFTECRGLNDAQLEDLYQETMFALLHRPFNDERHLRRALRDGIKKRALNLHRDEARRAELRAETAPGIHALEAARSAEESPEQYVLLAQDKLIAREFLSELTVFERRVCGLMVEGLGFNSIAKTLDVPVNEARNATSACERKLERFRVLYESGRLCGYRSSTIEALQAGRATSEELAQPAIAHLDACVHCRAEHNTNAQRLRAAFQGQAAALLPVPALLAHLGLLARAGLRARGLAYRAGEVASPGGGSVRERAAALVASGGAGVKIAAGVATTVVIAGGAVSATHVLSHPSTRHQHQLQRPSLPPVLASTAVGVVQARLTTHAITPSAHRAHHPGGPGPGRVVSSRPAARRQVTQYEPGGFAYLGVPTSKPTAPAPAPTQAQSGGGPFEP